MSFKLKKYENNPVLKANPRNSWEDLCVLNPGVWYENNKFYMLYRAAGSDVTHYIYLGLAESSDGFNFTRSFDSPVLSPDFNGVDGGCVEDPRIIKMGDTFIITYASRPFAPGQYWSDTKKDFKEFFEGAPYFIQANSTQTYLALSKDLIRFKKCGRITDVRYDDRDVMLFPEKIGGKYVRLSRPAERVGKEYGCSVPSVFINFSDEISEWDENQNKLLITAEQDWESKKIGGSCPPLKTADGWIFIYHGVSRDDDTYRVGVLLLDLNDPAKIIARTKDFIMEPEHEYETSGYYNGCVFPTGNVIVDGTFYVYYGAADKYCCAATCSVPELISHLKTNCRA